jgi:hypothetical protein
MALGRALPKPILLGVHRQVWVTTKTTVIASTSQRDPGPDNPPGPEYEAYAFCNFSPPRMTTFCPLTKTHHSHTMLGTYVLHSVPPDRTIDMTPLIQPSCPEPNLEWKIAMAFTGRRRGVPPVFLSLLPNLPSFLCSASRLSWRRRYARAVVRFQPISERVSGRCRDRRRGAIGGRWEVEVFFFSPASGQVSTFSLCGWSIRQYEKKTSRIMTMIAVFICVLQTIRWDMA